LDECPAEKNGTGRVAPDIAEDLCAVADSRGLRCRLRVRWRGISRSAWFAEDEPAAYALINAMRLDEDQIGGLELAIDKAEDPEKGVSRWLEEKEHRELVRPWIGAAKNAQEE
jgi:hypothetical protein